MNCKCHYIIKERAGVYCFLGNPGPEGACTSHKPPAKIDPPPVDPEYLAKWKGFGK
jgi:hypothetical protein